MTLAIEGPTNLVQDHFQSLQHDAVSQTPIDTPPLADQSLAWWENAGTTTERDRGRVAG